MVYLTKKEAERVVKELSNNANKEIKELVNKISLRSVETKKVYVYSASQIRKLLQKAFKERRRVKIRYYSPNNDEHTTRVVDVYRIYKDAITCFCHLRKEERNFVIGRINSAALLDEKYKIPKGWTPESIIL